MPTMQYLEPRMVTGLKDDLVTPCNPYVTGYGSRVPTRHWVKINNVWRRVYVMQYGNSGSAYVMVNGEHRFLDTATEYAFQGALSTWDDLVNM